MKELINTILMTFTTSFKVFRTLMECMGILADSAKDVTEVVRINTEAFKMEETINSADRISKLRADMKAKK